MLTFFFNGNRARSGWARWGFFVLLGILSQIRGVPSDGEKRVLVYTSFLVSPFSLRYF